MLWSKSTLPAPAPIPARLGLRLTSPPQKSRSARRNYGDPAYAQHARPVVQQPYYDDSKARKRAKRRRANGTVAVTAAIC